MPAVAKFRVDTRLGVIVITAVVVVGMCALKGLHASWPIEKRYQHPFAITRAAGDAMPGPLEGSFVEAALDHPPDVPLSVPVACHLLRLYGFGPIPGPRFSSGAHLIEVLTNEQIGTAELGASPFYPTRTGVRFRGMAVAGPNAEEGESHRDLVLATLAELGVPLETNLRGRGRDYVLADALNDSLATFDLRQLELPWTAVAFGLYASSAREAFLGDCTVRWNSRSLRHRGVGPG
jgi:hypothetical protein